MIPENIDVMSSMGLLAFIIVFDRFYMYKIWTKIYNEMKEIKTFIRGKK